VTDAVVRISIGTAAGSSEIHVGPGLLARAGEFLEGVAAPGPVLLVTDDTVGDLYAAVVEDALADHGFTPTTLRLPPGEESKTLEVVREVYGALLDLGADRGTPVVTLGGGVVSDLGGFAAATFLRGLTFLSLPTTLLAQVDASVGGKTGVNLLEGKNLVGAFHHPKVVLADTDTLATLDPGEFRSGLAEVVKMALTLDPVLLEALEAKASILGPDAPAAVLAPIVAAAVRAKAKVVMEDEREAGRRQVLNFGHTLGHALEAAAGYGAIRHGEAVAVGMAAALEISEARGLLRAGVRERALGLLTTLGLPTTVADLGVAIDPARLSEHLPHDKKMRAGALTLVLLRDVGEVEMSTESTEADTFFQTLFF
jgi:3-dehydroquinate synthase